MAAATAGNWSGPFKIISLALVGSYKKHAFGSNFSKHKIGGLATGGSASGLLAGRSGAVVVPPTLWGTGHGRNFVFTWCGVLHTNFEVGVEFPHQL